MELHASKRIYNKDTPRLPYSTVITSLDVLYTIACGLPTSNDITDFWEILSVNFTVMVLHTKQLVNTIEGMSKLLEASITTNGFGPRGAFEDEGVQRDPVALVLDKLTLNLIEEPRTGCSREEVPPERIEDNQSYGCYDRQLYRLCQNLLLVTVKDLKFYMIPDSYCHD